MSAKMKNAVFVYLEDNRFQGNQRMEFFLEEMVTYEIYSFVKKHRNVLLVWGKDFMYADREAFLRDYKSVEGKDLKNDCSKKEEQECQN